MAGLKSDSRVTLTQIMTETIQNIVALIKEFNVADSILAHDALIIELPSGFCRYDSAEQHPFKEWEEITIEFIYDYKTLCFSIQLIEEEQMFCAANIVSKENQPNDARWHYTFTAPLVLSIRQAKELLLFLQNYFCGFDLRINTKLER